jgi:hypothetical protein
MQLELVLKNEKLALPGNISLSLPSSCNLIPCLYKKRSSTAEDAAPFRRRISTGSRAYTFNA